MLLFSGVYAILVFAISYAARILPANGLALQKFFCINKWTFQGIYAGFIFAVGVGVISGAIIGWRYSRVTQKWFVPAAMLGIPTILVGWFLYTYAIRVSVPHSVKLMDCTNTNMLIRFTAPIGHGYHLEFKMPTSELVWQHDNKHGTYLGANLSGRVKISEGANVVTNLSITSGKSEGWIYLHKKANYDFEITFDQMPPPSTSVWLCWLQTARERNE